MDKRIIDIVENFRAVVVDYYEKYMPEEVEEAQTRPVRLLLKDSFLVIPMGIERAGYQGLLDPSEWNNTLEALKASPPVA